jgi:hypothetical protein
VELATELARLTKYTPASPHIDPRGALPQLLGILPLRPSDDMGTAIIAACAVCAVCTVCACVVSCVVCAVAHKALTTFC